MKQLAIAFAFLLTLSVMADDGDDTLRTLLGKSDLVVLGKIVAEPDGITFELGAPNYVCAFAVEDVLKGDATLTNTIIKVNIVRFETDEKDHHPLIKKDSRCILFLKKESRGTIPAWATSDVWLAVQHPFPWLARSLKRLAKEK